MTAKALGALLLMGAALWTALSRLRQRRRETALLRQLSDALRDMASCVRWQKRPLPDAIAAQARRSLAGVYFRQTADWLASGVCLEEAWHRAFAALPVGGGQMAALELSGDEEKLTGSLSHTAARLEEYCGRRQAEQRQTAKLWLAGALSAAGLLIILLM